MKIETILWIAVSVLLALTIIFSTSALNLRRSNNNWKHNYEVLQDSVEVVKTKNGELIFENGSLILEKNELFDALELSKKQVKEYEKALGSKLAYISKLEAQLNIKDTIKVTEIIHDTITNTYSMGYKDKWLSFDETFSLLDPEKPILNVYNINMDVPLKVGLGENYRIFVTSENPYFNITSIEGAVIDGSKFEKKISRWSLGAYGGFGLGYGLINKQIDIGPQVGIGVEFRFF